MKVEGTIRTDGDPPTTPHCHLGMAQVCAGEDSREQLHSLYLCEVSANADIHEPVLCVCRRQNVHSAPIVLTVTYCDQ